MTTQWLVALRGRRWLWTGVAPWVLVACPIDQRPLGIEPAGTAASASRDTDSAGMAGDASDEAGAGAGTGGNTGDGGESASPSDGRAGQHDDVDSAGQGGAAGSGTGGLGGLGGLAGAAGLAGGGSAGLSGGIGGAGASGGGNGGLAGNAGGGQGGVAGGGLGGGAGASAECPDLDQNGVSDCTETLTTNADFDTNVSGWATEVDVVASWNDGDARQAAGSGSLNVVSSAHQDADVVGMSGSNQCLPATAGKQYRAAAELFIEMGQSAQGAGALALIFYDGDGCTGALTGAGSTLGGSQNVWQQLNLRLTAPVLTKSVRVRLTVAKSLLAGPLGVRFDNVLFREGT